jgi:selenocysteine-specific elongation factor
MLVVATAGHVDHGKSTLVRSLTGTDPDRLAEEKARGLTIDLGFASVPLPSGAVIAFVDVPGHVRFITNMLAGVGAVDTCLFVVAADDGWMPQSEEHLRILDGLGFRHGLIAVTKADLVDDDELELVRLDIADRVAGTFLDGAPTVTLDGRRPTPDPDGDVSSGLPALRRALDDLAATVPGAADRARPRLWIDRSFAPPGAGTVVTGTLTGGALAVDDEVVVVPAGRAVRVRALQSLHRERRVVGPGSRVAVNLTGIGHHDVDRGDALVREGQWHLTSLVDARLDVLAGLDHPVVRRGAFSLHVGSGQTSVRLRVLGAGEIVPGASGLVRLYLARALPLVPGDRFVVRETGRQETVGGGEVLDVDPVLPASRARPDRSVARVVAERGWVEADVLTRLTGEPAQATVGRWVVDAALLETERSRLAGLIADAGPLGLDLARLDVRERAVVATLDAVRVEGGRALTGPDADPLADHPYLRALEAAPFAPPPPDGVDRAELRELVRRGLVVDAKPVYFAAGAVDDATALIVGLLDEHPDGVTVGEVREALGTSRKYALPLLAHLDGTGRTRRRGDRRIAGPRLRGNDGGRR